MIPPENILENAQLIKGIGASSWFTIISENDLYRIERFSLQGKLECTGLFNVEPKNFDINSPYEFTYISHCKDCTIIQNKLTFKFFNNEY